MILEISQSLKKNKIFHKIKKEYIQTRKTLTKIPSLKEDVAYLVGVIAGDGSLVKSKRKKGGFHYQIRIYAKGEKYLIYLQRLIYSYFQIKGKIVKDQRKKETYYLHIANAAIYAYFEKLEAKYNHKNKLPDFCINKKLFQHYMGGLIDTDGSVDKSKKRIQLKLKNKDIINEIYLKVENANPNPPKINYTKNVPFYYIRFNNVFPLRWKQTSF